MAYTATGDTPIHEDIDQRIPSVAEGSDEGHRLQGQPNRTDDSDFGALWEMHIEDFNAVLEDESHPLNEKAQQVAREMAAPLAETLSHLTRPISGKMPASLDTAKMTESAANRVISALLPNVNTSSWFSKLLPETLTPDAAKSLLSELRTKPAPSANVVPHEPEDRRINFNAIEPPDATVAEVREVIDSNSREILLQQLEYQRRSLEQARTDSEAAKEELEVSRKTLTAAKIAAIIGVLGAAIGLLGLLGGSG